MPGLFAMTTITGMMVCGLAVGWRAHNGIGATAAAFGLLLLRYAVAWAGIALGLTIRKPETMDAMTPLVFPLTMLGNTFVPTSGMPAWLRVIAEWNPVSAAVAACRDLFGNPGAAGAGGEAAGAGDGLAAGQGGQAVPQLVGGGRLLVEPPLLDGREAVAAQGGLGQGGQRTGEGDRRLAGRPVGHHPVDQPHGQRLGGADRAAGEDQVHGPPVPDQAGEPDGAEVDQRHAGPPRQHAEHGALRGGAPVAIAFRSAPAQNAPPAPASTATELSGSASKARKAPASAAAVGPSTALRRSGRLMVTTVTGPSRSTSTVRSAMASP